MEIKTEERICKKLSYNPDKKWVAVDDVIALLNQDVDMQWAIEKIEESLLEHHTPAENIMNLIRHIGNRIRTIEKELINEVN